MMNVCALESRRGSDMASLIERQGAIPTVVPTMREVPLESNSEAIEFGQKILQGAVDAILFLTGVGATALKELLETQYDPEQIRAAVDRCLIAVRGPKPYAVLSKWNIHIDVRAPEPNTWRELLQAIEQANWPLSGLRVGIQEYGAPNPELSATLRQRGAVVETVTVYRWDLPEDLAPLQSAIKGMVRGDFQVLLVTSAQQVRHAVMVAEQMGLHTSWLAAARRCVIGSIGPTASEALREYGLEADLEPSHPKMGHLVIETLQAATQLLSQKNLPRP